MKEGVLRRHADAPPQIAVSGRIMAVMAGLVALIGLAGFAGWLANGETLFWSLIQDGLAWCF